MSAAPRLPEIAVSALPPTDTEAALERLQGQFDVLAREFVRMTDEYEDETAALRARIAALEAKVRIPNAPPDVEAFAFVLPATENAPPRRWFDANAFLGAIAERAR